MQPSATPAPPTPPNESVRGIVSFLLFLHLFALAVAISSHWSASPLELALRNVPGLRPYTQLLALDQPYVELYHLTYGMPIDTDHALIAELRMPDRSTLTVSVPPDGVWPAERYARYARLATGVAEYAENEAAASLLPQAVAAHLLARHGATGGVIRCRRHYLQSPESVQSPRPVDHDPYNDAWYSVEYEAQILVSGGQVQLLKTESARDVAPAADSSGKR